ncbi:hypothetical protein GCM10029978_078560 [Actinoallomurus acanthiterrae]
MTEPQGVTDPIARATLESVRAFNAAIDRLGLPAMTAACELTQLDRLIRRYPEAARKSLQLHDREKRPRLEAPRRIGTTRRP